MLEDLPGDHSTAPGGERGRPLPGKPSAEQRRLALLGGRLPPQLPGPSARPPLSFPTSPTGPAPPLCLTHPSPCALARISRRLSSRHCIYRTELMKARKVYATSLLMNAACSGPCPVTWAESRGSLSGPRGFPLIGDGGREKGKQKRGQQTSSRGRSLERSVDIASPFTSNTL